MLAGKLRFRPQFHGSLNGDIDIRYVKRLSTHDKESSSL